jgi:hypothetical protein
MKLFIGLSALLAYYIYDLDAMNAYMVNHMMFAISSSMLSIVNGISFILVVLTFLLVMLYLSLVHYKDILMPMRYGKPKSTQYYYLLVLNQLHMKLLFIVVNFREKTFFFATRLMICL